jgi:hypothetical protein
MIQKLNLRTEKNLRVLLWALLTFGLVAVPMGVKAADTTVSVAVNGVISVFTTSGTVTLGALTPDATGVQSTNKDTVTVTTTDTDGYTLTLKDADTTYTLASGGDSFAASSGTPASPITLINNTWGWRVDSLAGFGAGPTSVISSAAPSALTFAAIPANGTPYTINSSGTNGTEVTDVWYSARALNTQPSGTYTDLVTYTAAVI